MTEDWGSSSRFIPHAPTPAKLAGGYFGQIFQTLQKEMNFTTSIGVSPDRKFGSRQKDGSFNGMVGRITKGKVKFRLVIISTFYAKL